MKTMEFGKLEIHECNAQEWAQLTGMGSCVSCVEQRIGKRIQTVWAVTGIDDVYTQKGELDCKDVCWVSATGILFTDGSYGCLDCYIGHGGLCKFKELEMLDTQVETFAWMFNRAQFIG